MQFSYSLSFNGLTSSLFNVYFKISQPAILQCIVIFQRKCTRKHTYVFKQLVS
jgi:hypothetical protein